MSEQLSSGYAIGGRYLVDRLVGRGGQGTVYKAVDQHTGRSCAVKLLGRRAPALRDVLGFKREFRAAARFDHPCCVKVYQFGEEHGHWFFTMEYVPGESLSRHTWERVDDVVWAALQTLAALDQLHARQIIHKDIKPSNILVQQPSSGRPPDFAVKLSDFGLAGHGGLDEAVTFGRRKGTLPYISPEQASGYPLDPRADLYSLGAVLYKLLAGRPPLEPRPESKSDVGAWLKLHREVIPPPLGEVAPHVPQELSCLVMQMLAKNPNDRPASAALVFDALSSWLARHEGAGVRFDLPPLARSSYLCAPPLVGRSRESRLIDDFLARAFQADASGGHLLIISGEAGVGKSKLLGRLLRSAESAHAAVLLGTCRNEPGAAYEPLRSVLDVPLDGRCAVSADPRGASSSSAATSTAEDPARGRSAALEDVEELSVTKIVEGPPSIGNTQEGSTRGQSTDPNEAGSSSDLESAARLSAEQREGQLWQFYRRMADRLMLYARKQPCLVVVEDLQWADAPTLEMLGFLLRATRHARDAQDPGRVAFAVTHRPAADHAALAGFRQTAESVATPLAIELSPLEEAATAELVAAVLGVPRSPAVERFTARLAASGIGGNPLYVSQLLHSLLSTGQLLRNSTGWNLDAVDLQAAKLPLTVHEAIGERAARFSAGTNATLAVAAVIGRQFSIDILQPVLALDQPDVLDNLDEAIRSGFVEDLSGGQFRFSHDRFRDAVYDVIPQHDRRELHASVAKTLELRFQEDQAVASDIAHHYLSAQRDQEARQWCMTAGRLVFKNHAFAAATHLLEHAVQLTDKIGFPVGVPVLETLGIAALQCGKYDLSARCFNRVLGQVRDPAHRADTFRRLADVEYHRGDTGGACERLEQVLHSLKHPVPSSRAGVLWGLLKQIPILLGYMLFPFLRRKTISRKKSTLGVVVRTCLLLAETLYYRDLLRATYFQLRALSKAEQLGPSPELAVTARSIGFSLALYGIHRVGLGYFERAREELMLAENTADRAFADFIQAMAVACAGDSESQRMWLKRAETHSEKSNDLLRLRQTWLNEGDLNLVLGNPHQEMALAKRLWRLSDELNDDRGRGWALYHLGHASYWLGDFDEGVAALRRGIDLSWRGGDPLVRLLASGRLSLALALHGDLDEALDLGHDAARELARLGLRSTTMIADAAFLTAAALKLKRDRSIHPGVATSVRRVLCFGWHAARSIRYTTPLFLAGSGAWHVAKGRLAVAKKCFARAVVHAEDYGLRGELWYVHAIAAAVLEEAGPEGEAHAQLASRLRDEMRERRPRPIGVASE